MAKKERHKKTIISADKGKEYSDISRELEATYYNWLAYSGLTEERLKDKLNYSPIQIEERTGEVWAKEICIYSGFALIGEPLAWDKNSGCPLDEFRVNALLLLALISSKTGNDAFSKEVKRFSASLTPGLT